MHTHSLGRNRIGDEGAKSLSAGLEKCTSLQTLKWVTCWHGLSYSTRQEKLYVLLCWDGASAVPPVKKHAQTTLKRCSDNGFTALRAVPPVIKPPSHHCFTGQLALYIWPIHTDATGANYAFNPSANCKNSVLAGFECCHHCLGTLMHW